MSAGLVVPSSGIGLVKRCPAPPPTELRTEKPLGQRVTYNRLLDYLTR